MLHSIFILIRKNNCNQSKYVYTKPHHWNWKLATGILICVRASVDFQKSCLHCIMEQCLIHNTALHTTRYAGCSLKCIIYNWIIVTWIVQQATIIAWLYSIHFHCFMFPIDNINIQNIHVFLYLRCSFFLGSCFVFFSLCEFACLLQMNRPFFLFSDEINTILFV